MAALRTARASIHPLPGFDRTAGSTAGAIEPVSPPFSNVADSVSVLVAEDDPVSRKVMRRQLMALGFSAHFVCDGRGVLPALGRKSYRLLLLDCQLPGLGGIEIARRIRADEMAGRAAWPSPLRMIAITASAMEGDREACLAAGMNDFLPKPVDQRELHAAIARQLADPAVQAAPASPVDIVVPMAV